MFDAAGNLLFSDVQNGRVLRQGGDSRFATVATLPGFTPDGMALDSDSRLFIAVPPGSTGVQTIMPEDAGFFPSDLICDAARGFYFTDCRGTPGDPAGGVYYAPPGGGTPVSVIRSLAVINGVALSPGQIKDT